MLVHENPGEDKHVESLLVPCLDEGSTPSRSTNKKIVSNQKIANDFFVFILYLRSISRKLSIFFLARKP